MTRAVYAAAVAALLLAACAPAELPTEAACAETPARSPDIVIAGTGASLPIFSVLADLWGPTIEERFGRGVTVASSIGTAGAVRALRDEVIDIGLGSRPLREAERGTDVRELPYLRAPIRFVGHLGQPPSPMTVDVLISLLEREPTRWPTGEPLVVIQREPGDSGLAALEAQAPALYEALEARRPTAIVAYTDAEAAELLQAIPGAIALVDPIAFEGEPDLYPVDLRDAAGAPVHLSRQLTMLIREPVQPEVAALIALFEGMQTRVSLHAMGYMPPVSP